MAESFTTTTRVGNVICDVHVEFRVTPREAGNVPQKDDAALVRHPDTGALLPVHVVKETDGDGPPTYGTPVEFTYTNWEGKTSNRRVIPSSWYIGTAGKYHKERGLMLRAWCLDRSAWRTFAATGIHASGVDDAGLAYTKEKDTGDAGEPHQMAPKLSPSIEKVSIDPARPELSTEPCKCDDQDPDETRKDRMGKLRCLECGGLRTPPPAFLSL